MQTQILDLDDFCVNMRVKQAHVHTFLYNSDIHTRIFIFLAYTTCIHTYTHKCIHTRIYLYVCIHVRYYISNHPQLLLHYYPKPKTLNPTYHPVSTNKQRRMHYAY